jgi:hypothetical protein
MSEAAHEEMVAMSHSDKDVAALFLQFEIDTATNVISLVEIVKSLFYFLLAGLFLC